MARLEDKINEIPDAGLRQDIAQEVAKLKKRTRFGLVFEEHQPEVVPIYDARIKRGERVALRTGSLTDIWRVLSIRDGQAHCEKERGNGGDAPIRETFDEKQLIVVRRMGEAIYPALTPLDAVKNGDPAQPHHILIEADNYHALQLMLFPYEGKVDCIYIDPPYNTGARDWKYNNNYVDSVDAWQHSKWLTFMTRRLKLARRLLKPDIGVLIVTIDEHEVHHLGCLLEQEFPDYYRQMVTIVINPKGTGKLNFARVEEHALFCIPDVDGGVIKGTAVEDDDDVSSVSSGSDTHLNPATTHLWELRHARRRGSESSYRPQRPNQFYPIYINEETREVIRTGSSIPLGEEPNFETTSDGLSPIWPIDHDGNHRCWRFISQRMQALIDDKRVVLGRFNSVKRTWTINIWEHKPSTKKLKTVWWDTTHDAGTHGTTMLHTILGVRGAFAFPKSLYAVRDTVATVVADRPTALIVDFFAGSGTSLNAVNLLNNSDGGLRQCILVTNNEVSEEEARNLSAHGFQPGQEEWDRHGICRSVTWPRSKFTILGRRDDGTPLPGDYLTGRQVVREKQRSIRQLGFAEGRNLALPQRKQIAALLPSVPQSKVTDAPWFLDDDIATSVLWDVRQATAWLEKLAETDHVTEVCVVTLETPLFNAIKAQVVETLGPQTVTEDEKRPMAAGFAANLEYFRLDFLEPGEVQMGRQFAAILPILWMMAGARGPRPEPPDAHAPWLLPAGCPFAVLMQETRFKDFLRHVEARADLSHIFVVTNSTDTVYKLRQEWPERRVVQLYKDYLENFRINLTETPAP